MSDTNLEQTEPTNLIDSNPSDLGEVGSTEITMSVATVASAPPVQQRQNRPGNVEHLAVRYAVPPIDVDAPEVKQRLSELRTEVTTLATEFRWNVLSVQDTAERMMPLLNVGSVQQWAEPLVATLLEIDRSGNLAPVWLKVIEQNEMLDLPANANPAETMLGRARRFAMLMLGNYKSPELADTLGKLATDANSSLYATQSLAKQATTPAMHALIRALKDAEGWAKVDIVEACVTLNQPHFHNLLLASGLDRAAGLESYIAIPLFRSIELERYIRGGDGISPRLSQQAVMIVSLVLQDNSASTGSSPIIFERNLSALAFALFESTRGAPNWRSVIALHALAQILGRYWADISRGTVQELGTVLSVNSCLPMMPDVERWMNGPGREVLLEALNGSEEDAVAPCIKALGELREPRAVSLLVARLDAITQVVTREQALQLASICETLGRLGDRRVVGSLLQLVNRAIDVASRTARSRRRDNLPSGDANIPGSIAYAAVIRALGQLGERAGLDLITRAASDFDPYVRTQALEALRRLDPTGEEMSSRLAVREALNDDPRDTVVRLACQLAAQYRDAESAPALRHLAETRSELAGSANDALRQLGQVVV